MIKIYCTVSGKYRKFKNPNISYISDKTLSFFNACRECGNENKRVFKEEETTEILKILDLIINVKEYQKM